MTRGPGPLHLAALLIVVVGACERPAPPQAPPLGPTSTPRESAEACARPDVDGPSIERFALDGTCRASDEIVSYRCPGVDVPVLRLAGEGRAVSFLGGPFAVRVEAVPANVRFVGSGTDGSDVLVADPGSTSPPSPSPTGSPGQTPAAPVPDEPLVYVRRDGVTERWLRLERRGGVADPPVLWLIGDSIMDGGSEELATSLADWAPTIDAEVGRPSSAGVALAAVAVDHEADVVVVELGTNDPSPPAFRDHLVETLDVLLDVPLVVWQTARGPADDAAIVAVNEAIREIVPRYPNVAIADWERFVPEDALMDDGIHPQDGFESLESDLLAPILAAWRAAVSGDGATACADRVLRSA